MHGKHWLHVSKRGSYEGGSSSEDYTRGRILFEGRGNFALQNRKARRTYAVDSARPLPNGSGRLDSSRSRPRRSIVRSCCLSESRRVLSLALPSTAYREQTDHIDREVAPEKDSLAFTHADEDASACIAIWCGSRCLTPFLRKLQLPTRGGTDRVVYFLVILTATDELVFSAASATRICMRHSPLALCIGRR
jgi:hypothetical protein